MPTYRNLPANRLELLDGNLIVDDTISGPVVLVIGTAYSGPTDQQVLVRDSNLARKTYGEDSPIIKKANEIKLGGAKNVVLYRIGGKAAELKNLFGDDTSIATVEQSSTAGSKYSIYLGPQPNNAADACLVVFEGSKIVYSNIPGALVNLGKITVEGFDVDFAYRVGTPTSPVLLESALAALKADVISNQVGNAVLTDFDLPGTSSASTVIEYIKVNGTLTTAYTVGIGSGTAGADEITFAVAPANLATIEIKFNRPVTVAGASYSAGENNIGASYKKYYELLDKAYTDLETTIATEVYVDKAILDAPNVADGSVATDKLDYLLKGTDANGDVTYEWSGSKTLYKATQTFNGTGASVDYALTGAASADTQIISVSVGGVAHAYTFDATTDLVTLNAVIGVGNIEVVYAKPVITVDTDLDTSGQPIIYKKFNEVNFVHQLGEFAFSITENERFVLCSIGTSGPVAFTNAKIAAWIGTLPETDIEGAIIGNGTGLLGNKFMAGSTTRVGGFYHTDSGFPDGIPQTDSNGALIDLGKFLSVVPAVISVPTISSSGLIASTTNAAAMYTGLVTTVTPGNSTTNELLPRVSLPFQIKKVKLDELSLVGYVVFQEKTRGVVCCSGELATNPNSDYDYISTSIIIRELTNRIRTRLDVYLGKGIDEIKLAAMQTAVDSVFQEGARAGMIKKYVATVIPTSVFGVTIPYTVVPVFELRDINNIVKLSYDI